MKHIHTFESFLNEGAGTPTVNSIFDEVQRGTGWASVEYVRQSPLNRAGKMALAQKLAAEGILFDDDALSDEQAKGNASPVEDGVTPISMADAKRLF